MLENCLYGLGYTSSSLLGVCLWGFFAERCMVADLAVWNSAFRAIILPKLSHDDWIPSPRFVIEMTHVSNHTHLPLHLS